MFIYWKTKRFLLNPLIATHYWYSQLHECLKVPGFVVFPKNHSEIGARIQCHELSCLLSEQSIFLAITIVAIRRTDHTETEEVCGSTLYSGLHHEVVIHQRSLRPIAVVEACMAGCPITGHLYNILHPDEAFLKHDKKISKLSNQLY